MAVPVVIMMVAMMMIVMIVMVIVRELDVPAAGNGSQGNRTQHRP
ncbi:hypothetical protein N182_19565 [Sinorhizobium sp. GL2]|nr:hypothetical protein N182_19565 [Sinorhizobium sp. GL2]